MGRLQLPPVFYRPNYGDGGESSEDRVVNVANPMETEYTDVEETVRVWTILVIKYYISCHDAEAKYFLSEWHDLIGLNYALNKYKYNFFQNI